MLVINYGEKSGTYLATNTFACLVHFLPLPKTLSYAIISA